jgi:hypothetical protein
MSVEFGRAGLDLYAYETIMYLFEADEPWSLEQA